MTSPERKQIRVNYYGQRLSGKYYLSHSYDERWDRDATLFCPECGKQGTVWADASEGDYYVGPEHICAACGNSFHLPHYSGPVDVSLPFDEHSQHDQRLRALKEEALE